jgi:hypothetical protein
MSTKMYRKTTCQGCGYSQETNVSYRSDKKQWNTTHTLAYCRSRKAHPVNRNRESFDQTVIVFGEAKMSVVRDSVDL